MIRAVFSTLALVAATALAQAPAIAADDLEWKYVPGLARPIEVAVISGDPSQAGPYVVRYRMPSGMRLAPMKHPDDRELTILKGIFWLSEGESFNWRQMDEFKAGTVLKKDAGKPYFGWARTAVILEERGTGPTTIEYVHPDDDPRTHRRD
jgi:hypothetical protein